MTNKWVKQLNEQGSKKEPCFFLIDYTAQIGEVYSLENLSRENILFEFPHCKQHQKKLNLEKKVDFNKSEIDFNTYKKGFNVVMDHLKRGDAYLVNLTYATPVSLNLNLFELYHRASAKYKVIYKDQWVCFSPETFIKIIDNEISTYPMKGTIDARIPHAAQILTNDLKEKAEHSTIVDLLRNDLSQVAKNVLVKQFMYLDKVQTNHGDILQMSSEIVGGVAKDWHKKMGNILQQLLPAGSICGAPKKKTLEIIAEAENYHRGFYTGIAGYYNGETLDTCVLIRFIEKTNQGLMYKSGGGITAKSDVAKEYQELNQKIYVPIHRKH